MRTIQFIYRKIIDASNQGAWEKWVWEDTYKEYLMQVQLYDHAKKYPAFGDLIAQIPAAEQMHFLVGTAITGYIRQLKGVIPDIQNGLGKRFLGFQNYRFEIINSDTRNKSKHQVAIHFLSEEWIWHDTIGEKLLISRADQEGGEQPVLTEWVVLQPFLGIYSLQETPKKRKDEPNESEDLFAGGSWASRG